MLRILLLLCTITIICCHSNYEKELDVWKGERLATLIEPFGWPSVVGLFPIEVTYSFFGSSDSNEFVIPNGTSSFGHLEKTDSNTIIMRTDKYVSVLVDSQEVHEVVMKTDQNPEGPTIAHYRSLQWHIIKRDEQHFLRVKDTLSVYRKALIDLSQKKGMPSFPVCECHAIEAHVMDMTDMPKEVNYTNQIGQDITRPVAAYLSFVWADQTYQLTALDNDEESYFIIVNDKTTGISTYGGGRFLYPQKPDSSGMVVLDFNRLINPPCVFTPYATCPLPPKANHLPFEIKAGEKDMHLY